MFIKYHPEFEDAKNERTGLQAARTMRGRISQYAVTMRA